MKDAYSEYSYNGEKYKLVFNLNVMEDIQNEYGTIDAWGKASTVGSGEINIKAVKYGFIAMTNEGIDIDNELNGTKRPPITARQAGRIMSELGLDKVGEMIREIVIKSTPDSKKNMTKTAKASPKK